MDNTDIGYQQITVERPLKLKFTVTDDSITRVKEAKPFIRLATSKKRKDEVAAKKEVEKGELLQQNIIKALDSLRPQGIVKSRKQFSAILKGAFRFEGLSIPASLFKAILMAIAVRDETAIVCIDRKGNPEPDTKLRDYEKVPLKEDIDFYMTREVLPYVPDAWVDKSKTKIGYEINFNRYFYKYTPPRSLDNINADLKEIEKEIVKMLDEMR